MRHAITLDFTRPFEKYLKVTHDIIFDQGESPGKITLVMPAWTPGSYLVRDFSAHVEAFAAISPSGRKLKWRKTSKNQWMVACGREGAVRITYAIYANDLSVRAAYLDHEFAFANGPAVYFHPDGFLKTPIALRLKLPPRWTAVPAKPARRGLHSFNDFDELYDTPILAGAVIETHRFHVGKTSYRLSAYGPHDGDLKRLCRDLSRIVKCQNRIFGGNPCRNYVFQLLFIKGGYGGLEHRASSSNIFDGFTLKEPKRRQVLLALLAHEHFHLWNVKRIRPAALGPFDYSRENYTRELWIAEGVTSYYDDHTVFRAGFYSRQEYLDVIADNIAKLASGKGARVNSMSAASFDAWLRFYRPNENTPNRSVSYYVKGGLVMMLLDFAIIRATACRHDLDDVMRALYRLYLKRPDTGITREEFFAAVAGFTRSSWDGFVADYIDGTKPVDWRREFADFGLDYKVLRRDREAYAGITAKDVSGKPVIERIDEDSPAFHGILQVGDEILAINGRRIETAKQLKQTLTTGHAEFIFCRRGLVDRTELSVTAKTTEFRKLIVRKTLSPRQKRFLRRFLRVTE